MRLDARKEDFIAKLAKSAVGRNLIDYLKEVEIYYADIRNLDQVKPEVRIDALKMFRESLLDKLIVLSGEIEPPSNEFT